MRAIPIPSSSGIRGSSIASLILPLLLILINVEKAKSSTHFNSRIQSPISIESISSNSSPTGYPGDSGCMRRLKQTLTNLCSENLQIALVDDHCCKNICKWSELVKYCDKRTHIVSQVKEYEYPGESDTTVENNVEPDKAEVPPASQNQEPIPPSFFQLLKLIFDRQANPPKVCQRKIQACGRRLGLTVIKECEIANTEIQTKNVQSNSLLGPVGKRSMPKGHGFISRRVTRSLVDDCCFKPCCVEDLREKYCRNFFPEVPLPEVESDLRKLINVAEDKNNPRAKDSFIVEEYEGSTEENEGRGISKDFTQYSENNSGPETIDDGGEAKQQVTTKPPKRCQKKFNACGKRLGPTVHNECEKFNAGLKTKRFGNILAGQFGKRSMSKSNGYVFLPRRVTRGIADDCCNDSGGCCVELLWEKYCGNLFPKVPFFELPQGVQKLFNPTDSRRPSENPSGPDPVSTAGGNANRRGSNAVSSPYPTRMFPYGKPYLD